jgi:hypothetical protein
MIDLKRLAMGRRGFARPEKESDGKDKATDGSKPKKTLEESCREEIGEAEQSFRARMAREDTRRRLATDSEFWFAVYFESREGKDRFLRKYGLANIGDKYLPGRAVDMALSLRGGKGRDMHRR